MFSCLRVSFLSPLLWLVAIEEASAQSLSTDTEVERTPVVWVQCEPISGLLKLGKVLPTSLQQGAQGLGKLGLNEFEALGGRLDGAMTAYGQNGLALQIPFGGSLEQVPAMLQILQPESVVWQTGKEQWDMELVDDHWTATMEGGMLHLNSVVDASDSAMPQSLRLLQQLPQHEGCWIFVESDLTIPKTKLNLNGGLFLPFGNDAFSVIYKPEETLPSFIGVQGVTPMEIHTPKPPAILMTLGFDWEAVLLDTSIQQRLGITEQDAKKMLRRIRLQPGGIIAFQDIKVRKDPKILAGFTLHNRFDKPQCAWLIWRGVLKSLRKSGIDPMILDKHLLSFEWKKSVLYVGVDKGRIYLSNLKTGVEEMMANEGEAWVQGEFATVAESQSIAIEANIPTMLGTMMGGLSSVDVGLRRLEDMAQVTLELQMSHSGDWTGLLPFLAGQLPDIEPPIPVSGSQRIVQQLAAREHQAFQVNQTYTPIGRTGVLDGYVDVIPMQLLDTAPMVASASMLGWVEQPTDGVYWVETSKDGFVVHGVFVMEGILVHYTKDQLGQIEISPIQ